MATDVETININNGTYYFFDDMINIKNFDSKLLKKIESRTKTLIFTTLDTSQLKNFVIEKIFIV